MADLFDNLPSPGPREETLAEGAVLLRGFAGDVAETLLAAVDGIAAAAPFRHLVTPGGYLMSVAMTNCGAVGWVSDRSGYRYDTHDPTTGEPWPPLPAAFLDLAAAAAAHAGFPGFAPDACLINRYEPGTRLSLHQDRDERDTGAPIVSVSLGLPATFLFGGLQRSDPTRKVRVEHGDVAVWGGPARLAFHGIAPLAEGSHARVGRQRINLTFRKAL
ncbi:MAG TPA: DNA oxidative demethylase AlkB [Inquilinus sp.]|nr:DNA oxidative demethylase AlkB [Inquilinus sp.]